MLGQAVFAEFFEHLELRAGGGKSLDLKVKLPLALLKSLAELRLASLVATAAFLERLEFTGRNGRPGEQGAFSPDLSGEQLAQFLILLIQRGMSGSEAALLDLALAVAPMKHFCETKTKRAHFVT
jgi:hypothetical protein